MKTTDKKHLWREIQAKDPALAEFMRLLASAFGKLGDVAVKFGHGGAKGGK